MGKLREPVFYILNAIGANDPLRSGRVGPPEGGLVYPVRLLHHPLAETESFEHLHRSTGDAVGLPDPQRPELLVDDPCRDTGELRELRSQG